MAEILINGLYVPTAGGPAVPTSLGARLVKRAWPGGRGQMNVLRFHLGRDTVEISMIEPEQIRGLIASLQRTLADLENPDG
jgi:hypothetical protein